MSSFYGGEGGIRTPGPGVPGQLISNQPPSTKLGHLSKEIRPDKREAQNELRKVSLLRDLSIIIDCPFPSEERLNNVLALFLQ